MCDDQIKSNWDQGCVIIKLDWIGIVLGRNNGKVHLGCERYLPSGCEAGYNITHSKKPLAAFFTTSLLGYYVPTINYFPSVMPICHDTLPSSQSARS